MAFAQAKRTHASLDLLCIMLTMVWMASSVWLRANSRKCLNAAPRPLEPRGRPAPSRLPPRGFWPLGGRSLRGIFTSNAYGPISRPPTIATKALAFSAQTKDFLLQSTVLLSALFDRTAEG